MIEEDKQWLKRHSFFSVIKPVEVVKKFDVHKTGIVTWRHGYLLHGYNGHWKFKKNNNKIFPRKKKTHNENDISSLFNEKKNMEFERCL